MHVTYVIPQLTTGCRWIFTTGEGWDRRQGKRHVVWINNIVRTEYELPYRRLHMNVTKGALYRIINDTFLYGDPTSSVVCCRMQYIYRLDLFSSSQTCLKRRLRRNNIIVAAGMGRVRAEAPVFSASDSHTNQFWLIDYDAVWRSGILASCAAAASHYQTVFTIHTQWGSHKGLRGLRPMCLQSY